MPDIIVQDLAGKTAVVTGASRGIGRAIALSLACRGASVIATCSSPASLHHLESLNTEIAGFYRNAGKDAPKVIGIAANLLSFQTPSCIADAVGEHFHGKLNILVNNAAYDEMRPMGQVDDEYVQKILTGNIHTLVMTVELLFRRSAFQPKSRIINISSGSTRKLGYPSMHLLAACKAAMESLTRSWAEILGNHPGTEGTTVNALLVGLTATDAFIRETPADLKDAAQETLKQSSGKLGEMGLPQDVADVAGLLAGEQARWITGSVVSASGGMFLVM